MAKRQKSAKGARGSSIRPGDQLAEGVAIALHDDGVLVGRAADDNLEQQVREPTPDGHSEHVIDGRRYFLAHAQAPIPAERLHPRRSASDE